MGGEGLFFLTVLFLVAGVGYVYFFQISPAFVDKPELDKPVITDETTEVEEEEIMYLLNELDAYKLHVDPLTKELPIIKVIINDANKEYYYTILENQLEVIEDGDPDIILNGDTEQIIEIMSSDNFDDAVVNAFYDGKIDLEIISDEKTLALKGYKSIYDKMSNGITGNVVNLNPKRINNSLNLSLIFFVSTIIGLIIEKEV